MKNVLLIILAMLFSYSMVQAQQDYIRLGIKGGANLAQLVYDIPGDEPDNKYRFGWHAGAELEIPVTTNFAIQPELIYSDQGEKYTINREGEDVTMSTRMSYLNLPVMAKLYLVEGFSVEAGPQIGLNLDANVKEKDQDKIDLEDIRPVDFGMKVGVGYQFDVGVFAEGRYYRGFSNINDASNSDDHKFFHNLFQLSVGYKF